MDFSRNTQAQPAAPAPAAAPINHNRPKRDEKSKLGRVLTFAGAGVLALGLIVLAVSFTGNRNAEAKYVDDSKLQAVFLNTGQVYFGNVKKMTGEFIELTNIYYLQTSSTGTDQNQQAQNTSVSLVKLGCELHEPFDKMLINRDQVTFWENLQDNGQVAKAVATFQKQNPNGQKCADQSQSAGANSNTVQNAGQSGAGNPAGSTQPANQNR